MKARTWTLGLLTAASMACTGWAQDGNSGNSSGGGQTDAQRDRFENAISNDLDSVRDHTGSPAETISDTSSARAVTYGQGVVIGDSVDSNGSNSGWLMEQEVGHVVDQAGNESQPQSSETSEDDTGDERVGRQRLDRPIERRTRSRSIPD